MRRFDLCLLSSGTVMLIDFSLKIHLAYNIVRERIFNELNLITHSLQLQYILVIGCV